MAYQVDPDLKVLDPTDYTTGDPIEGTGQIEALSLNHNLAAVAAGGALVRLGLPLLSDGAGSWTSPVLRVQLTEVPALRCTCVCAFARVAADATLTVWLEELDGTLIDSASAAVPAGSDTAPAIVQMDLDTTAGDREALCYWTVTCDGSFALLAAELAPFPAGDCDEGGLSLPAGEFVPLLDPAIPATDLRALDVHTVTALLDAPRRIEANRWGHFWHYTSKPGRSATITNEPERVWWSGDLRATGRPIELWVRGQCGVSTTSTATWTLRLGDGQVLTLEFDATTNPTDPEDGWMHAQLPNIEPGVWSAVLSCAVVGSVEILSVSLLEVAA